MRILGLDSGGRRIGVAMSDAEEMLASPLTVIEKSSDSEAIQAILELIRQYDVGKIIMGMPRHLNGKLGVEAGKVQTFIDELSKATSVPIDTRDEWLSTVAANRLLHEAGSRTRGRHVDAMAATFVLQGYLDSRRQDSLPLEEDGNTLLT